MRIVERRRGCCWSIVTHFRNSVKICLPIGAGCGLFLPDGRADSSNVTTLLQLGASYQRGIRPLVAGPFSFQRNGQHIAKQGRNAKTTEPEPVGKHKGPRPDRSIEGEGNQCERSNRKARLTPQPSGLVGDPAITGVFLSSVGSKTDDLRNMVLAI